MVDPTTGEDETRLISQAVTEVWEARQYRMNQLTAGRVFDYGCDDTICTASAVQSL